MTRQHYASTEIGRSIRQIVHALRSNDRIVAESVTIRAKRLQRDRDRVANALGRECSGLDVLIVGPGPYLVEPRFFGQHNNVTADDLDVIPVGLAPGP